LDGGGGDPVVGGVGADEADEDAAGVAVAANDEAAGVALEIKDDAILHLLRQDDERSPAAIGAPGLKPCASTAEAE